MLTTKVTIAKNLLPKLTEQMHQKAARAVAKAAFDIQALARDEAPVDTGKLRNSIMVSYPDPDDLHATVGTGVEYAGYVEWGTVHMPAHPYMTPAAEVVRPQFQKAMMQIVKP